MVPGTNAGVKSLVFSQPERPRVAGPHKEIFWGQKLLMSAVQAVSFLPQKQPVKWQAKQIQDAPTSLSQWVLGLSNF